MERHRRACEHGAGAGARDSRTRAGGGGVAMNRRAQLIFTWSGPLCALTFFIGAVLVGRFIPPWVHPSASADEVARIYAEHHGRILAGAFICIISMTLVSTWGVTMATQLRRREGNYPILSNVQLMCVAVGTCVVVLMSMFWATAAFRWDEASPETIRTLNDIAYFLLLFTWPPFAVWSATIAYAILADPADRPVYPRWVGWLSIWTTVLFCPAGCMAFFKHGAFSWAGLMALYVPVGIFFVWLTALTYHTIQNINGGAHHVLPEEEAPESPPAPARELAGVA